MITLIHIYCSTSLCVIYKSLLIHDIQVLIYRGSTNECLPGEGVAHDSYYNETDRVSRYPGNLGGICLNLTPKGPGMSLKEIRAKALLCDPSSYPKELERVYDKLNDYCKLRHKRKGLTKADDWEINFRKEVTRRVTKVNTARATKKSKMSEN